MPKTQILHTSSHQKKSLYKAPVGFVSCWALKIVDDSSMHAVPDVEWKWSCVARWCSSFMTRDFGEPNANDMLKSSDEPEVLVETLIQMLMLGKKDAALC